MQLSSRTKWYLIVATIVLVFVLAIPLLIMASGRRAHDRALADWLAAGGKSSLVELAPPHIPDEENAAILYVEAAEELEALITSGTLTWLDVPEDDADLAEHVAACSAILDKIHRASQMEQCAWILNYDLPATEVLEILLPHLTQARQEARLLRAEFIDHVSRDELIEAIESIKVMQALGTHTEADPTLIGCLVGIAIRSMAVEEFEKAFKNRELPANVLEQDFVIESTRPTFHRSLIFEGTSMSDLLADSGGASALGAPAGRVWYPFVRDHAAALYLERMTLVVQNYNRPYWEQEPLNVDVQGGTPWARVVNMIIPAIDRANQSVMRMDVQLAFARQAIRLRRYRAEHGTYPDPADYETITDPYSGEPLHYELTDTGFVLRSGATADRATTPMEWEWE